MLSIAQTRAGTETKQVVDALCPSDDAIETSVGAPMLDIQDSTDHLPLPDPTRLTLDLLTHRFITPRAHSHSTLHPPLDPPLDTKRSSRLRIAPNATVTPATTPEAAAPAKLATHHAHSASPDVEAALRTCVGTSMPMRGAMANGLPDGGRVLLEMRAGVVEGRWVGMEWSEWRGKGERKSRGDRVCRVASRTNWWVGGARCAAGRT